MCKSVIDSLTPSMQANQCLGAGDRPDRAVARVDAISVNDSNVEIIPIHTSGHNQSITMAIQFQ